MANFIVTYDLNGPRPSHKEVDEHLKKLGAGVAYARVLETVWHVAGPTTAEALRNYMAALLGSEDLVLVLDVRQAAWTKLLVPDAEFKKYFEAFDLAA